jgi:uncharacterized membrane protein
LSIFLRIIHDLTQVHPLHTMIVHFPIALTASALFFILLALWKRNDILEQVAFANLSLAAVSTIVAAVAGIRDNLLYFNGGAPNHIAKIILAITLFILTTITSVVRWRNKDLFHKKPGRVIYVLAYVVSFIIASVLGFLGGVIIYGF